MRFSDWLRKIFPGWVRYYNRLEIIGIENLPKMGSAIIAGNHSGSLDLDNFCTMSALEQFRTDNPARKRIWECYWDKWSTKENIWGRWVQKFSPIPISLTGNGIPYRIVDKIVKKGELLAIMPEGHSASIQEGYWLWKFYPGVIKLHLKYKIPIIPTANIGFVSAVPIFSNRYNPNNVPPWEEEVFLPFIWPRKLIIHYGKPLRFEEFWGKSVDKHTMYNLASKVRDAVKSLIENHRKNISREKPLGNPI